MQETAIISLAEGPAARPLRLMPRETSAGFEWLMVPYRTEDYTLMKVNEE